MLHNGWIKIKTLFKNWWTSLVLLGAISITLLMAVTFIKIAVEVIGVLLYICLLAWMSKILFSYLLKNDENLKSTVSA